MPSDKSSMALKPPASDDKQSSQGSSPNRIPSPFRYISEKSRRYLLAVNAFRHGQDFSAKPSAYEKRRATETVDQDGQVGSAMTVSVLILHNLFLKRKPTQRLANLFRLFTSVSPLHFQRQILPLLQ
jgi:hypothetical protein